MRTSRSSRARAGERSTKSCPGAATSGCRRAFASGSWTSPRETSLRSSPGTTPGACVSWRAWPSCIRTGVPDILEMADYQAEGFAAAHARRGQDPRLRNTELVVRLHTSAEMCADLNEAPHDLHLQVLGGLERFPLRFADALLEPGGNSLERYAEFYGADSLAPALRSPLPMTTDLSPPSDVEAPSADGSSAAALPEPAGAAQGNHRADLGGALAPGRGADPHDRGRGHRERPGWNVHARTRGGARRR